MNTKPPGTATVSTAGMAVLAVSASDKDQACLKDILGHVEATDYGENGWELYTCRTLPSALGMLQENHIPVVVFDGDSATCSWRRMLDRTLAMPSPPALIVTSRLADEHLWAEALNLGAYDVLAKPFDSSEVTRVLRLAWLHATIRRDSPARAPKVHTASGGTYRSSGGM